MLFNEKQITGITTELEVAMKLILKGYIVSVPYGNNSRYDLLVDTDNNIYRIQVKHAKQNSNGSYTIKTANSVSTTTKREVKHYSKADVDFIMTIIENQLVVIPVEIVANSESKVFRTELPQYGSKSTCNLIEDYTIERYII